VIQPEGLHALTPFERRILMLLAQGLSRTEIARLLHRSPHTISNTMTGAKQKLGAKSLVEAAVLVSTTLSTTGS
jgi:DNA-binding CsgD family transcriptional regulator